MTQKPMAKPKREEGTICHRLGVDVSTVCHKCDLYLEMESRTPQLDGKIAATKFHQCADVSMPQAIASLALEIRSMFKEVEAARNEVGKAAEVIERTSSLEVKTAAAEMVSRLMGAHAMIEQTAMTAKLIGRG